jgi:hypothetical protein
MTDEKTPWYSSSIVTIVIAVCLIVTIAGIVATVHRDGIDALKGTGLGALAALLAGALIGSRRMNGR